MALFNLRIHNTHWHKSPNHRISIYNNVFSLATLCGKKLPALASITAANPFKSSHKLYCKEGCEAMGGAFECRQCPECVIMEQRLIDAQQVQFD